MTVTMIMKNNLSTKGLSLSQAQSISNLCHQRAVEINNTLNGVNNAAKTFVHNGKDYVLEAAKPMPANAQELILERARLHATQAFLMSNIKMKDALLNELKSRRFFSAIPQPVCGEFVNAEIEREVGEAWGWKQLSTSEVNEFLEQEAYAAHIGQFIHKDSTLAILRAQLPQIKSIDFIELKVGEKTPVSVSVHHDSATLMALHESLATLHRKHEQRVNYFKAKVKNLVTAENARIAHDNGVKQAEAKKINQDMMTKHTSAMNEWSQAVQVEQSEFEKTRQDEIKATAALSIAVDARFQPVIDEFLKGLSSEEEVSA